MIEIQKDYEPFEIDEKRFYIPGSRIVGDCPNCKKEVVIDLSKQYLAFPKANELFDYTMYCSECDHEWKEQLFLHVALYPKVPSMVIQ